MCVPEWLTVRSLIVDSLVRPVDMIVLIHLAGGDRMSHIFKKKIQAMLSKYIVVVHHIHTTLHYTTPTTPHYIILHHTTPTTPHYTTHDTALHLTQDIVLHHTYHTTPHYITPTALHTDTRTRTLIIFWDTLNNRLVSLQNFNDVTSRLWRPNDIVSSPVFRSQILTVRSKWQNKLFKPWSSEDECWWEQGPVV